MSQRNIQVKPISFSEYFTKLFAECVARGIVEKSVKKLHSNNMTEIKVDENKNVISIWKFTPLMLQYIYRYNTVVIEHDGGGTNESCGIC